MKSKLLVIICVMAVVLACCFAGCDNKTVDNTPENASYALQYTDDMGMHTIEVKPNQNYQVPKDKLPSRVGYTFEGLYDAEQGGNKMIGADGLSIAPFNDNKDMTLYPRFVAKQYTVALDFQGGATNAARYFVLEYGSSMEKLLPGAGTINAPNGKIFAGWYTEPNRGGIQIADENGIIPDKRLLTSDIFNLNGIDTVNLYAGYKGKDCQLRLYYDAEGNYIEQVVEEGTDIADVYVDVKVGGKGVLTWTKIKDSADGIMMGPIHDGAILYALEYAPVVEFDVAGGDAVQPIVKKAGESVVLPTPTNGSFAFAGWYDENGNKVELDTMPELSIKLTARWERKIVLNENGGEAVEDIVARPGEKITLPRVKRDGFMFAGWYDKNGEKFTSDTMPSGNVELEAKYYTVQIMKKVLLGELEEATGSYYTGVPSFDRAFHEIDLTDIYNGGTRQIYAKVHYMVCSTDATAESPENTGMTWYSTKNLSGAYKIWEYNDEHNNSAYMVVEREEELALIGEKLYVSRYNAPTAAASYWKDFWVEFYIPNTGALV